MTDPTANQWRTISSKISHTNRWFRVRTDQVITPDCRAGEFNVVEQLPSVYVIAIDQDERLVLVGLYRYPTTTYSLEIPAGGSDGQESLLAAQRELREETGLTAGQWQQVGRLQSANGYSNGLAEVFIATDLVAAANNEQAAEGITRLQRLSVAEVQQRILDGTISDSQSIAAIYLALLWRETTAKNS